MTPSRALNDKLDLFCFTSILRTTTMGEPALLVKRSLMLALQVGRPMPLGSCTKAWPDLFPGGRLPVTEYLRASMIVVFPHPLAPTIMVRGKQNWITCGNVHGRTMVIKNQGGGRRDERDGCLQIYDEARHQLSSRSHLLLLLRMEGAHPPDGELLD